jgi:hypothetical protein
VTEEEVTKLLVEQNQEILLKQEEEEQLKLQEEQEETKQKEQQQEQEQLNLQEEQEETKKRLFCLAKSQSCPLTGEFESYLLFPSWWNILSDTKIPRTDDDMPVRSTTNKDKEEDNSVLDVSLLESKIPI